MRLLPLTLALLFISLLVISCASEQGKSSEQTAESISYPPVDTLAPEAKGQQPAFAGQTRVPGLKTQTPFQVDIITDQLHFPWGLDFLPDGRMIITEKTGSIRIVTMEGAISDTILGVPPVYFKQDGGLMDIILDPDFINTRQLFWSFSEPYQGEYLAAIGRAKLSADEKQLENVEVIYRASPTNYGYYHYGARLLFDPEGFLLACFGERFHPEVRPLAQSLSSALGKVIRITKDGAPAPGNPFANAPEAKPEIWALGFRDPQGLAFHPTTGALWLSDHGARAGDEINIISAGKNYGWPIIAYGMEYNGDPINEGLTQKEGMEQPVYYWDPAISPSGISFYSGAQIPEWKGNLFVTALRGRHLARLVIQDNRVIGEERLLVDQEHRMRDVSEGPDGALYVLTDQEEGRLIRVGK